MVEEQAEVVRRIFDMYINEGMGSHSIAVRLTDEGIPTQTGKLLWLQSRVHHILGNTTYTGTWIYGKYRHVSTEDGKRVYDQPRDTWVEIPIPQVIDDETWERAQKLKKQRSISFGLPFEPEDCQYGKSWLDCLPREGFRFQTKHYRCIIEGERISSSYTTRSNRANTAQG